MQYEITLSTCTFHEWYQVIQRCYSLLNYSYTAACHPELLAICELRRHVIQRLCLLSFGKTAVLHQLLLQFLELYSAPSCQNSTLGFLFPSQLCARWSFSCLTYIRSATGMAESAGRVMLVQVNDYYLGTAGQKLCVKSAGWDGGHCPCKVFAESSSDPTAAAHP